MATLGFEDYIDPLKIYLDKYREIEFSLFICCLRDQQKVQMGLQRKMDCSSNFQVPSNIEPKLDVPLLPTVLFYNHICSSADIYNDFHDMLLKLLALLPSVASHSAMIPLVHQVLLPMLHKDVNPVIKATAIRLICKTWEINDRVFGSLQGMLHPNELLLHGAEREICMSIAVSIEDICKNNHDRGVDIILSVAAFIDNHDPLIQSVGLQCLAHLCEADVIGRCDCGRKYSCLAGAFSVGGLSRRSPSEKKYSAIICSRKTEMSTSRNAHEISRFQSSDGGGGSESSCDEVSTADAGDATLRSPDYASAFRTVGLCVFSALVFGAGAGFKDGVGKASEFFAGYLLEQSLSVDNLFVFVLIFKYFRVPINYQSRVLSYGIVGAVIFHLSIILLGTATLQKFEVVNLLLATILLYSSFKVPFPSYLTLTSSFPSCKMLLFHENGPKK